MHIQNGTVSTQYVKFSRKITSLTTSLTLIKISYCILPKNIHTLPTPPYKMFRLLRPYPTEISNPHLWSEHGYFPEPCITQINSFDLLD